MYEGKIKLREMSGGNTAEKGGARKRKSAVQWAAAVSCTVPVNFCYKLLTFSTTTQTFHQLTRNHFMQFGQEEVWTGGPEGELRNEKTVIGEMSSLLCGMVVESSRPFVPQVTALAREDSSSPSPLPSKFPMKSEFKFNLWLARDSGNIHSAMHCECVVNS